METKMTSITSNQGVGCRLTIFDFATLHPKETQINEIKHD